MLNEHNANDLSRNFQEEGKRAPLLQPREEKRLHSRQVVLHVQDNQIVKVTSPLDHEVGHGHLCIKGRFGWQFVQSRVAPAKEQ